MGKSKTLGRCCFTVITYNCDYCAKEKVFVRANKMGERFFVPSLCSPNELQVIVIESVKLIDTVRSLYGGQEEEISLHLHVQHLISHYGYVGVFFTLLVEMIGVPFPAKTILIISGFEWMKGTLSLAPLLLSACLGNILGSTIAYGIGYYWGRPVIVRFGRYIGLTEDKLDSVEKKFKHYRKTVVLFSKFFTGVRVLVPYLSGINRMPFPRFTVYNAVGAVVWAVFFIIVGRYVEVAWSHYHKVMHQYLVPTIIVAVLVIGIVVAMKVRHKKKVAR